MNLTRSELRELFCLVGLAAASVPATIVTLPSVRTLTKLTVLLEREYPEDMAALRAEEVDLDHLYDGPSAPAPGPVTQPWTHGVTLMQQAVLLECLRGPDGVKKYHPVKYLLRWYRRCVLRIAFGGGWFTDPTTPGGGSFTGPCHHPKHPAGPFGNEWSWEEVMDAWADAYMEEVDAMPLHFHTHLMHCAEVLGYCHPDDRIRLWWMKLYYRFAEDMHLKVETRDLFAHRLGDDEGAWRASADPATTK